MPEGISKRTLGHYLFSSTVLVIYGGQVCPFVDSLAISSWTLILALLFGLSFGVRAAVLDKRIKDAQLGSRAKMRFMAELSLFLISGLFITVFNMVFFGFPFSSGVKITLGFLSLGFFTASDLALDEERKVVREVETEGIDLAADKRVFSLTAKFSFMASMSVLFMVVVMFLVLNHDLSWLTTMPSADLMFARRAVLTEALFVGVVFLVEVINLILSYAKNLAIFFTKENSALHAVSLGHLDSRVPVGTNDEFGVMARYTNSMITDLRTRTEELQRMQDVTIMALKDLAETRDNETGMHILRTQRYVKVLAEHLRNHERFSDVLDDRTIDLLFKSAPLHDIGKVGVPDSVLLKPARLTPDEFEEMKKHTVYGRDALARTERMLGESSFLRYAREIAYTHDEKWDGSGYPNGLRGDEIPVSGRLMAVADVYDALVFKRVYKDAMSHETARDLVVQGKGAHFDPDIVDAFLSREDIFRAIAKEFADEG